MEGTTKTSPRPSKRNITIVIILSVSVIIFLSRAMDNVKGWNKPPPPPFVKVTNPVRCQSHDPPTNVQSEHDYSCQLQPLSPADTQAELLLLKSNLWPETPPLSKRFSFGKTSNPKGSNFYIIPKAGGREWHVGDPMKVRIEMKDFFGNHKETGGDLIIARLHNPVLHAGVAGKVVDHGNGSYSAEFPLLWIGRAQVEVTLIYSSEAITVLRRINQSPRRLMFDSIFRKGKRVETSQCQICLPPTKKPICNYTDIHTGDPWFCYKPKTLPCNTRISHVLHRYSPNFGPYLKLFKNDTNMKVFIPPSGTASLKVLPSIGGVTDPNLTQSGYYFKGVWKTLRGPPVRQFNTSAAISQCLQNKMLHLYGDSTIKQWYKYLIKMVKDLKPVNNSSDYRFGPFLARDRERNTSMLYRIHGIPLLHTQPPVPLSAPRYIANELDSLVGGPNTVVVIGVWAHFGLFPTRFYIRRMHGIRKAVIRLLNRAPDTLVVIRNTNFRIQTPSVSWVNNDFHTAELEKILRGVFQGVNVRWVDALEMTVSHYIEQELHPSWPIVTNMVNVLLSFICPERMS